jgi:hypothetical protein
LWVPANLLGHSTGGTFEFDASVGSKLFVTLSFEFPFHIIKRIASERTREFQTTLSNSNTLHPFGRPVPLRLVAQSIPSSSFFKHSLCDTFSP